MSKRFVVYNGETARYAPCTDPDNLRIGRIYEILKQDVSAFHTEYTLRGIDGEFNSVWFNEADDVAKSYLAFSWRIPEIGKSMTDFFRFENNQWVCMNHSSIVQGIEKIGSNNIYKVYTLNTIYILQIQI